MKHATVIALILLTSAAGATDEDRLDAMWDALREASTEEDAAPHIDAFAKLGDEGVAYLQRRMTEGPDADLVRGLVEQLNAGSFPKRDEATQKLIDLGPSAHPQLAAMAAGESLSVEQQIRIARVLEARDDVSLDFADLRRQQYAVRAMTRVARSSDAAFEHMQRLMKQTPFRGVKTALAFGLSEAAGVRIKAQLKQLDEAIADGDLDRAIQLLNDAKKLDKWGYNFADELDERQQRMLQLKKIIDRVKHLRGVLKKKPGDTETREALMLELLAGMDNPSAAAKLINDDVDAGWKRFVPMMQRDELTPSERVALATWCHRLAERTGAVGQMHLLQRAAAAFEAAAADPRAGKNMRESIARQQQRVKAELDKLIEQTLAWTNLLVGLDAKKHAINGSWARVGEALRCNAGKLVCAALPFTATGGYELNVDVQRLEGADGIFIQLPLPKGNCNLNLGGWDNAASGLEMIDGREANSNETTVSPSKLSEDKKHHLQVIVRPRGDSVDVFVRLDGEPYLNFSGKQDRLTASSVWGSSDRRNFAVGAYMTAVEFSRMRVRPLSGKIERAE